MKLISIPFSRELRRVCLSATLALLALAAIAGPGAHGPDGAHLDGPPGALQGKAEASVQASSERFELVARLQSGELSLFVDRFDSNEPVLGAQLEVESGALKANARFRPESGDYAVTDAALLAALHRPGEHALVFTLVAGQDSDLLDATLTMADAHAYLGEDHSHTLERALWIGGAGMVLGVFGLAVWQHRRRRGASFTTLSSGVRS